MRVDNRSGNWAFMRRMELVRPDGTTYLARMRVVQTPWFALYFHRMESPDPGLDLHDHPWPFISWVIRGGYREIRADTRDAGRIFGEAAAEIPSAHINERRWMSIKLLRLTEAHTIYQLKKNPTWTLVFCGRRVRPWGFYTENGWYEHSEYEALGRRELSRRTKG